MMKYLVLFAVLFVVYMLWRAERRAEQRPSAKARPAAPAAPALPQDMVRCPVCSVHLPRGEALPGANGQLYCSPEHRLIGGQ